MATPLYNEIIPTTREPPSSDAIPTASQSDALSPSIDRCVICLDQISDKAVALPCRHDQFDFPCLGTWLQRHQVCPLCKAEVTAVRFRVGGPGESKTQVFYLPLPEQQQAGRDERGTTTTSTQQQGPRRRAPGRRRSHNRAPRYVRSEVSKDTALDFRREVYRRKLCSLHVGSNRISRYRNLTPGSFAKDERLTTRARMFIRRDLQVFDFFNPDHTLSTGSSHSSDRRANNADFLLEYMIGILRSIDLKSSTGQAEELLKDFLGRENARLFLHELESWLRSPYEHLEDWDRAVQYAVPSEADGQDSETSNSRTSMDVCNQSSQSGDRAARSTVPAWFSENFVLRDQSVGRT